MTSRQRVLTALAHEQPDRVPYNVRFTQRMRARMVAYLGDPAFEAKLGNCLTIIETSPEDSWHEVRPGIWRDQFGVDWDRHIDPDIGNVCNTVVTPGSVDAVPFPDPDDSTRYEKFRRARAADPDTFLVANIGFSLYERAWTLAGLEFLLGAMISNPGFVHRLLDRIVEYNLRIIRHACKLPVDAIFFGDDWGQQTGVIMGARRWREFLRPRLAQQYRAVRDGGKCVFIHSCGKVDELLPDLIECGVDVFNPFQPEVMDVFEIKRRYGDRLTFYGGISTQRTLPYGTVAQVKDDVRRLIDEIGRGGGYIASPAHDIPADAKPENVMAMMEVLQRG
jgi:uroporphyrinogen decarboxylase